MFTACLKNFVFLFFLASSFFLALDQFRQWRLIRIIRMKNKKKEATEQLFYIIKSQTTNKKKPSWNVRDSGRVEFLFDIFRARVVVFLFIRFSNFIKKKGFDCRQYLIRLMIDWRSGLICFPSPSVPIHFQVILRFH
jgi:hypothetical protein